MHRDLARAHVWELGAATEATTGVGPIPEFTLGQLAATWRDD